MTFDCGCDDLCRWVFNILSIITLMCLPILQRLENLPDSLQLGPRIDVDKPMRGACVRAFVALAGKQCGGAGLSCDSLHETPPIR